MSDWQMRVSFKVIEYVNILKLMKPVAKEKTELPNVTHGFLSPETPCVQSKVLYNDIPLQFLGYLTHHESFLKPS